ncbi:MAG: ATP-dependent helicase HrpB [Gemmatimonadetes bacterium]|nr:ATP-dependent helicase HrpB [Gemmatimonadota bacterium]
MSTGRGAGAAPLPIDDALPALRDALASRPSAVLEAPPGAGKTTRVPLALLHEPWLGAQRIVMLEPRRLAARAAATYMARTLNEPVGHTVGYRVRGDTRISARTRIEVVTEGVLTRLLAADAALEPYGAVLFDEFHERSLHADLGLALVLEMRAVLRPDLRVLVMSATLDGDAVARLLADDMGAAPVVRSSGRLFPITTHHRPPRADERIEAATARVVREALAANDGDVLVFLPGFAEQRRVAELLGGLPPQVRVHQLHGSMPLAEQDAALAPAPAGTRKVVLSTNVAETSLTVEGVRIVVDSGMARVARYDAGVGMTRLRTARISRASADQRRGRAGRVAPGVCWRLWDAHEEHGLLPATPPEIVDADLAELALELADAGVHDPATLRWLDVPKAGPFTAARTLLAQLGALDANGRITAHGKRMAELPLAPRLAHMVLVAEERGELELAAALAVGVEGRGEQRQLGRELVARVRGATANGVSGDGGSGGGDRRHGVRLTGDRRNGGGGGDHGYYGYYGDPFLIDGAGALLALAFPDRVAQRRAGPDSRYLLRNGAGAVLPTGHAHYDLLHDAPFLAIAELEGQPPEYRIARAAALSRAELDDDFGDQVVREQRVAWDDRTARVQAVQRVTLGAIVLEEKPLREPSDDHVRAAVLAQLTRIGVEAWPLSVGARRLRERLAFVHAHMGDAWPEVSDDALVRDLSTWLAPYLDGVRTWAQLEALDWHEALLAPLDWQQRGALDRLAPTHLEVPSGSRIAIDYSDAQAPVLAVKLQEVFGWTTTPRVCDGRVPVTLHLLSPAQRPVQVTRDLAGFWASSYFEVRKELRGRYPRHPWPEDPLTAEATRRAKPRGT